MEIGRANQGAIPAISQALPVQAAKGVEAGRHPQGEAAPVPPGERQQEPAKSEPPHVWSKEKAKRTVEAFNDLFVSAQSHLKFVFHEKADEYYVQIIDDRTREVIKEIPPKKLLDLVAAIKEKLGLILDEKI